MSTIPSTSLAAVLPTAPETRRGAIVAALPEAAVGVSDPLPTHQGKVRDVFIKGNELLLVASDRVSAFDVVLGTVPLKGQLLTAQSAFWLEKAAAVAPTHLLERVDAAILRCRRTTPLPVEVVVRGYLAGSLAREPSASRGAAWGLKLDPAQAPFTPFERPILTPTTKAAVGDHDEPMSTADLVASSRVTAAQMEEVESMARALFAAGQAHAADCGLILVDTKYEFGIADDGGVVVIDEIHTADSSRFWKASSYAQRLGAGEAPEMLDKENLRRWLIARGYQGQGTPPTLDEAVRVDLADFYWRLTEDVTGAAFVPMSGGVPRLSAAVRRFLST